MEMPARSFVLQLRCEGLAPSLFLCLPMSGRMQTHLVKGVCLCTQASLLTSCWSSWLPVITSGFELLLVISVTVMFAGMSSGGVAIAFLML